METKTELTNEPQNEQQTEPSNILQPVQILLNDASKSNSFILNDEALQSILTLDPETCNLPIAILSVAGAFRKGKSFFINIFLNYLKNFNFETESDIPTLFKWRGGTKRDTAGILAWPKLLKITVSNKNLALLILDTQGTFDEESTIRDNSTIFALACMTSSQVIFNLSGQLQEDNLQSLELFTSYGKLALENYQTKPFQKLTFLIRDWQVPYEYAFGRDTKSEPNEDDITISGNTYVKHKLRKMEDSHKDLENVREHIRDCFEKTECFLLPHPGKDVARNPKFSGQISKIDPEFLKEILVMCASIVNEIQPKKINGDVIKSCDLLNYFQTYASIFEAEELPEPKTMLQATAEANLLVICSSIRNEFEKNVLEKFGNGGKALSTQEFDNLMSFEEGRAFTKFDAVKKLGDKNLIKKFRNELIDNLGLQCARFKEKNDERRVAYSWKTPATMVIVNILTQIAALLLRFLFLGPIASIFSLITYCGWLMIGFWSYGSYTDQYSLIREKIDEIAEFIGIHMLGTGQAIAFGVLKNPKIRQIVADVSIKVDKKSN